MLNAKTALLQALISGEGYGLELADRIREKSGGRVNLGQGTLYPALRALEREGLVRTWKTDPLPERGGRPRVMYELTADGRRAAREDRNTIAALVGLQGALV